MTVTPQTFQLDRWVSTVLPGPGLIHRLILCAVGSLYDHHGADRVVGRDEIADLVHLDLELVDGALVDAAAEGLVTLAAGGDVRPVQEPVELDVEAQERRQLGLELDCTCGAAAGWPCTSNRGRITGHHQVRRRHGAKEWSRLHQEDQVNAPAQVAAA